MKTKMTFNYYLLVLVFLIGTTVPLLSYDYFVENLTSIIRKATNIVEADVLDVKQTVDEHNSSIRVVTLKVNEDIVGGTINPTITLKFLVLDYEGINQPLSPNFKIGEKVILHLKKYNDSWTVLGHDQGKFEITGSAIEGSSITASNFKQQIKDIATMKSNTIDIPLSKKKLFKLKDIEQYEGEGISKLGGEFHVLDPVRYGPTSGNIQFHINPANAKDKDGNSLSFNDIKAAIQRAVDSWNNVNHSYVTFTVSSSSTSNSRSYGNGVSTITFESDAYLGSNGATWTIASNGIITEVDMAFNYDNRWNTNITYPSSYTIYNHPRRGQIGPVDLEDVVAHELGHGVGLHHVGDSYSTYTLYATIYSGTWWEKTWRRSLEIGDKAGKIYQDPNFPSSITQQNQKVLLSARPITDLYGTLTVPSNYSLQIEAGKTIRLNNNSIISTGGTITKQAGATINGLRAKLSANLYLKGLCSSIQTAANYAGSTNEIYLEDGNFNENVTINNKYALVISGNQGYDHFGNLTVTNCNAFEGIGFGAKSVYVNNSNTIRLVDIYAYGDQSSIGFYLYNSDTYSMGYLISQNSQAGITCSDGTEADIEESWLDNNLNGLRSYNGSNVSIYNSHFCGTGLDLKTYNFSQITSHDCYFDGGTPSVSGSNIYHYGDRSCSISKISSDQQEENNINAASLNADNTVNSEFERINSAYFTLNKRLGNAIKEKSSFDKEIFRIDYEKVIKDFKEFIDKNPESPLSKIALVASAKSYRRINDLQGKNDLSDMKNFLSGVMENKDYAALKPQAERLMIEYYRLTKDFTSAIETADNIIENYKDDADYLSGVMYAKGLMLSYDLNQPDKAAECFSSIIQQYPQNSIAELAENELRILGQEVQEPKTGEGEITSNTIELSSYPNPFNPITIINYSLPTDEKLVIKVYDILGREIKELVNEFKTAGKYSVQFDGSNLASGVYLYRITAGSFSLTKKLLLTK